MKLVMTLRTRDQADIVDAVVAFHLNAGVDFVIATDHRSEDGTVEILESYAREGHLLLFRERGEEVRGSEWRTRMARLAATEHGADWVFSADGDEFWWPRGGDLKEVLAAVPARYGVVVALSRPFVPILDGPESFSERMTVRLAAPAPINDVSGPYRPYTKVAHRADAAVVVERGNHAVLSPGLVPLPGWHPIEVLHFPMRSAEQLTGKYLAWERALGRKARGTHVWAAVRDRQGRTADFVSSLALDPQTVARGLEEGSLVRDTRLRDVLRELGLGPSGRRLAAGRVPFPGVADAAAYAADLAVLAEADAVRLRRRLDRLEAALATHERRPGRRLA
jgi:hypothetical protein